MDTLTIFLWRNAQQSGKPSQSTNQKLGLRVDVWVNVITKQHSFIPSKFHICNTILILFCELTTLDNDKVNDKSSLYL